MARSEVSRFSSQFAEDCFAASLEFVGTFFFLFLAYGGIQAAALMDAPGQVDKVMYIASSMGFSLLVSAWLFYRVTGSLFNPNISLALLLVGIISPVRFVLYCTAQMIAAVAAAGMVLALTPGELASANALHAGVSRTQGVFIEMFITAALVLAVLMLAAEKHHTTPFAPIGIGLTLFACHLFAVYFTGAAMNTARAFGPAAVTGFKDDTHWVFWLGPFLGSIVAAAFYTLIKHYRYWTINPEQATVDPEKSPENPVKVMAAKLKRTFTSTSPSFIGSSHTEAEKDSPV
jgi:aquaporin related protein